MRQYLASALLTPQEAHVNLRGAEPLATPGDLTPPGIGGSSVRIVRIVGLEPTRPKALEPKSSASANSAKCASRQPAPQGGLAV